MFEFFKAYKKRRKRRKLQDKRFDFLFDACDEETFIALDTETTGLDVKHDEILSIGAVKIYKNKILTSQTFEVFVRPKCDINSKSISIHHIRPCDLSDARDIDDGLVEFLHFIKGCTLVGYYLEFDVAMLNKYIKPLIGTTLPNDTVEVSEIYYDKTISLIPQGNIDLRFDTILKQCNIPDMGAHNAVNDAIMTAMIYLKLTKDNQ